MYIYERDRYIDIYPCSLEEDNVTSYAENTTPYALKENTYNTYRY